MFAYTSPCPTIMTIDEASETFCPDHAVSVFPNTSLTPILLRPTIEDLKGIFLGLKSYYLCLSKTCEEKYFSFSSSDVPLLNVQGMRNTKAKQNSNVIYQDTESHKFPAMGEGFFYHELTNTDPKATRPNNHLLKFPKVLKSMPILNADAAVAERTTGEESKLLRKERDGDEAYKKSNFSPSSLLFQPYPRPPFTNRSSPPRSEEGVLCQCVSHILTVLIDISQ
ncbi:hypothetical protein STEG23_030093, partial [Scotinomys teguina]